MLDLFEDNSLLIVDWFIIYLKRFDNVPSQRLIVYIKMF